MRLQRFLSERSAGWSELDALLRRADGRPARLGADGVRELGTRYREAAADLAVARRAFPAEPSTLRLEALVGRARQAVYAESGPARSPRRFLTTGYWQAVRRLGPALAVAAVLFFGAISLGVLWGDTDPDAARGVVPAGFIDAADPPQGDRGLSTGEKSEFSSQVFTNNIRVGLLTFAAGLLFGVGAAVLLLYNGLVVGSLLGVAVHVGTLGQILRLITAHGVLELSTIVVEGATGLALGWALVEPGRRSRGSALRARARPAMAVLLGTIPWIVLAGLAEGYVSPSGESWPVVLAVGFGLGGAYWSLVLTRGRDASAPAV